MQLEYAGTCIKDHSPSVDLTVQNRKVLSVPHERASCTVAASSIPVTTAHSTGAASDLKQP